MAEELTAEPVMGQCMITGKRVPEDELVTIQGYRVCAEGKAILLERLKAGEQMPGEMEKPSVLLRFGCILVDGIVWLIPSLVLGALGGVAGAASGGGQKSFSFFVGIAMVVLTILEVVYFGAMHAARGQTLGKMAGKIRVVNVDGTPIEAKTAYIRALAYLGPSVLQSVLGLADIPVLVMVTGGITAIYGLANVITALVTPEQRALHDLIAGTRVVKNQ